MFCAYCKIPRIIWQVWVCFSKNIYFFQRHPSDVFLENVVFNIFENPQKTFTTECDFCQPATFGILHFVVGVSLECSSKIGRTKIFFDVCVCASMTKTSSSPNLEFFHGVIITPWFFLIFSSLQIFSVT